MSARLLTISLLLAGCSQGGGPPALTPDLTLGPAADLATATGGDGGAAQDLMAPADMALPPAEGKALWGRSYSAVQVQDVAAAPDGSIYLVGSFSRADLGDGQVTSSGASDGFVIKFDKVGQRLWARTFGRAFSDVPTRVTADPSGAVAIVGYSLRTADSGTHDAFVAVYAPDGAQRLFRTYGGPDQKAVDTAMAVGFAADGGLWISGGFEDRIDLGGGTLIAAGSRDLYLLRISAAGAHVLSRRFGFTGYDQSSGLSVLPDGDVVIAGTGGYPIDFGDGNVGADPQVDTFLVRFSPGGVARWSKRFQVNPYSTTNVTSAADGSIWYVGDLNGAVDFGGGPRAPATGRGIFWAHYTGTGAHLGSYVLPASAGIYLTQAAVDSTGQLVMGGRAEGDIDFGAGVTTRADGQAFFFKSAQSGLVRWARRFGGVNSDAVVGVAVLPGDQVVAAVNLSKTTQIDTVSLPQGGAVLTVTR